MSRSTTNHSDDIGNNQFFTEYPLDYRKKLYNKIKTMYPDRVVAVVSLSPTAASQITLNKVKFLVPIDLTVAKFMLEVKKQCSSKNSKELLRSDQAMFLSAKNRLLNAGLIFSEIEQMYSSDDGFVYITIQVENTFG